MKQTIESKTYNTDTAEEMAGYSNGLSSTDFNEWSETLYRTVKGAYFLHGAGGPLSKYSEPCGDLQSGGQRLVPMTETEALTWCEDHQCERSIAASFSHLIEDA